MWSGARRPPDWLATLSIIALVAVVAAGMAATVGRTILFTPEKAVSAYFSALAAHDATGLPEAGRADLVAGADYVAPSGAEILASRRTGDAADVDVSFALDGQRWAATVRAHRLQWWGPWRVDGLITGLDVLWPAGVDLAATIGGRTVDDGARLHPGVYTVALAENDTYTAPPARLLVTGTTASVPVAMFLSPRPELTRRLQTLINGYLADCVARAPTSSTIVADCPLRLSGIGAPSPENVSWTLTAPPVVSLVISSAAPLEVLTSAPGSATVTYTQGRATKAATVPITIGGWAELDAGRLIWHRDNLTAIGE
ncbi:hypothetical protein Afil01_31200 [Actinorhabdospora filicis]|uniref:Uncharacterized protein n=1 Tax=Actinorhabdospora filicis TaxID=1785913 RepID=A0A9W6SLQ9_9ACTN|nr:hypothetical protein Afil01_31200 [Actinorhabdospora filicis]